MCLNIHMKNETEEKLANTKGSSMVAHTHAVTKRAAHTHTAVGDDPGGLKTGLHFEFILNEQGSHMLPYLKALSPVKGLFRKD